MKMRANLFEMLSLVPRSLQAQALRWNCPWHRTSFRPCRFPFKMDEKLKTATVQVTNILNR